jgi:hypothetical protein
LKRPGRLGAACLAGSLLLLCFGCAPSFKPAYEVGIDDAYDRMFTRSEGWTGGDVASTVRLSASLTLWLFGDSWVGPVVGNRHAGAEMINNAVAVQHGTDAVADSLRFYYGEENAKPAALFTPPDGRGFYWLSRGGIRTHNGLYLVASQVVKKEGDSSVFGFEVVGNSLLAIDNPTEAPPLWRPEILKIPFFGKTADGVEIDFGDPQFVEDGRVYIYGLAFDRPRGDRFMLLARAPESRLREFLTWEFYDGGRWQSDFRKAGRLCSRFGAEFSVSFVPGIRKYVTIYSELGMSDKIMMRTAPAPEGPWSEQEMVYRMPDPAKDKDYFGYAAKGHAGLSGPNDLLVSYVCNATDFRKMASDASIYRPRFLRIRFHSPADESRDLPSIPRN